ncbi:hypothetical protein O1L60_17805 [Streptomyces diastatochromogenes]|nr:hypothetical protein [Streptomyces diastatochromogenes]
MSGAEAQREEPGAKSQPAVSEAHESASSAPTPAATTSVTAPMPIRTPALSR